MLTVNKPALVDDRKSVALACCAQQPKKNSASELCGPILVPLSVGKFGPMLLLNLLYWLQLICVVISSSSDEKSSDDLTSAALTRW
jgi:hypothetical protein